MQNKISSSKISNKLVPQRDNLNASVLLAQVFNMYIKTFSRVLYKNSLTVPQWMTLYALYFIKSPMSPTTISKYLPIETNSISVLLDKLEKRKLVRRRRSRMDKRAVNVYLTEEGSELLAKVHPKLVKVIDSIFGTLSKEQHKHLYNAFIETRNSIVKWNNLDSEHADLVFRQIALLPVTNANNIFKTGRHKRCKNLKE